jgi:hypothetical protein
LIDLRGHHAIVTSYLDTSSRSRRCCA